MEKPVVYAEIPEFDELTQYVVQADPVATRTKINVGVDVLDVVPDPAPGPDGPFPFMPGPPIAVDGVL